MLKILLLCVFVFAASGKRTFNGSKVFRIIPTHESQLQTLQNLSNFNKYNFWNSPTYTYRSVDVMVSPRQWLKFYKQMNVMKIKYKPLINDVQALIDSENEYLVQNSNYHSNYHRLAEIYDYLHQLAKEHPDKVQVVVGGKSFEGREIKGVKVTFNKANPGVFIEGGIHAREWIAPATVTYILDQLLNSNDPEVRFLAERHNWFIFPVFNPDGYEYSHTKDRLWRKTRTPYKKCFGADMNRNFNFRWKMDGASADPCSDFYAGKKAKSEVEVKTISRYIKSVQKEFYAYISFHSYSQLLLFPFGYTTVRLENYKELHAIAMKSIEALARKYGTEYITGSVAEMLYITSGSSVDWIKGVHKKRFCFIYELRDKGRYGFILPQEQIIPTGQETLDSLIAMFKEISKH